MLRWLIYLILLVLLVSTGLFIAAGRATPPSINIERPDGLVGQQSELRVSVTAPAGTVSTIAVTLEQNGKLMPLFALDAPQSGSISQPAADQLRVSRPFGKAGVPELQQGPARLRVTATRPSSICASDPPRP